VNAVQFPKCTLLANIQALERHFVQELTGCLRQI
jgi:hypothetical protein